MRKKKYDSSREFIDDLHLESLRDTVIFLGYLKEDDFRGSKVRCPFHDEKTPSMQVTDDFFRCYGCGARGDLIKWIELSENLNFIESLRFISRGLGVELTTKSSGVYDKNKFRLSKEWKEYQKALVDILKLDTPLSRHIRGSLSEYFPLEIGYDKVSNYIVLPFTSKTGDILGFTSRRVDFPKERSDRPKWIHSNLNNSLIKYCSNIFNLDKAHLPISKSGMVYIVEGPKDVAAFRRIGVENVVSVSGTSGVNKSVIEIIGNATDMILCFDGDSAGKEGMIKNIINISKSNPEMYDNIYIIDLPEGKDPGDIDPIDLKNIKNSFTSGIEWFIKNSRKDDIINLLSNSPSIIIRECIPFISVRFGMSPQETREWIRYNSKRARKPQNTEKDVTYKDRLLSTIGKVSDINIEPLNISEDEALKILKLRFNYEGE